MHSFVAWSIQMSELEGDLTGTQSRHVLATKESLLFSFANACKSVSANHDEDAAVERQAKID